MSHHAPTIPLNDGIKALGLWGPSEKAPPLPWPFVSDNALNASQLCHVYLRQIDPVIKILHKPSLSSCMLHGENYLGYPNKHPSHQAIRSAVCYSAASSMTEKQCRTMFHANKSSIMEGYRRLCETALERSGILATQDIAVLQAFVLYLVSVQPAPKVMVIPWTVDTSGS